MSRARLQAAAILLVLCIGTLPRASGWGLDTHWLREVFSSFQTPKAQRQTQLGSSEGQPALALPKESAKTSTKICGSKLVCPGCLLVEPEAAAAVLSSSCQPSTPRSDRELCGSQQLDSREKRWIRTGQCAKACTDQAESLCTGHRRLLQEVLPPSPFNPLPDVPVSYASPFEDIEGLATAPGLANASQYTTHWLCGTTQLNADAYHSLRLTVENGACENVTASPQYYLCGGTVLDEATYEAVATGTCSVAPCSATASCTYYPKATALPPSACPGTAFSCGSAGEFHVAPDLYSAILSSTSCSTSSRQSVCIIGSHLVEQSLYVSVKTGNCAQDCSALKGIECSSSSSAPDLAPSTLPCSKPSYLCGNQTVDAAAYNAVLNTASCQSGTAGLCQAGSSLVDANLFAAIKAGTCVQDCSQQGSTIPCKAIAPTGAVPSGVGTAQTPCSEAGFDCGNGTLVPSAVYAAIKSGSCNGSIPDSCLVSGTLVDRPYFDTVKEANCIPACIQQPEAPCPAKTVPIGPAPAFSCGGDETYTCGFLHDYELSASLYQALSSASSCTPISDELCRVGDAVLSQGTWVAVKSGTCISSCQGSKPLPSTTAQSPQLTASLPSGSPTTQSQDGPPASTPCQTKEVVCRGADLYHMLPEVYQAIQSSDQGCNMGICVIGVYVVEQKIWEAVKRGNCETICLNSGSGCPGQATAPATALELHGSSTFLLHMGEWDVCNAECSDEAAYRPLTCLQSSTNLPVSLSSCPHTLSNFQMLSQPCGTTPCGAYAWETEDWSDCSVDCGEGTATRNVSCTFNGQPAAREQCNGIPTPLTEQACFLKPCSYATWRTTDWSDCANGVETRTISCVLPDGTSAPDQECQESAGYTIATSQPCNRHQCNSDADCGESGTCDSSSQSCVCSTGYTGPSCNIFLGPCSTPPAAAQSPSPVASPGTSEQICCPTGVVDHLGNCCASGVVAGSASCCPVGSILDNVGECCPPEKQLDACGTCGGSGQAVDFLGRCCSGELDGSGICCPPPLTVDIFGVCGGSSNSGNILMTIQASLPGDASSIGAVNASYSGLIAQALNVPVSQILFTQLSLGGQRRRLSQAVLKRALLESQASEQFQAALSPPYESLPYAKITQLIGGILGSATQHGSLVDVRTQGISGNGVCEVGELPNAAANGAGSSSDCPLSFKQVPLGGNGPCNGHGTPFYSQGQCNCYVGYEGSACDTCTPGYSLQAGMCIRTYNSFQGYTILSGTAPAVAGASLAMPLSIAVVGVVTVFAIASVVIVRRKRKLQRSLSLTSKRRSFFATPRGRAWSFGDPERGSRSSGRNSSKNLQAQKNDVLNSTPLAHLVGWLSNYGLVKEQEVSSGTQMSTETGITELPSDTVLSVQETPRSRRARATIYTVSSPDHGQIEKHRQRHMTWTQAYRLFQAFPATERIPFSTLEEDQDDRAIVLRSPSLASPSQVHARRTYSFTMEHLSPLRLDIRRSLNSDFDGETVADDFTAVPAAPHFQPVPEFQPTSEHGLLTDASSALDTPPLCMIETAPPGGGGTGTGRRAKENAGASSRASAYWNRLPWEQRREVVKTADSENAPRWTP